MFVLKYLSWDLSSTALVPTLTLPSCDIPNTVGISTSGLCCPPKPILVSPVQGVRTLLAIQTYFLHFPNQLQLVLLPFVIFAVQFSTSPLDLHTNQHKIHFSRLWNLVLKWSSLLYSKSFEDVSKNCSTKKVSESHEFPTSSNQFSFFGLFPSA